MQEGRPLAFTSKQLSEQNLGKSIYENEMLAILHIIDLWHPYLLGQCFQIRIDHQSLKYFLEQHISLDMIMRSFTGNTKTMWLRMHFPENMKMKGPFFLSPLL
jgi:hypothetical protein